MFQDLMSVLEFKLDFFFSMSEVEEILTDKFTAVLSLHFH